MKKDILKLLIFYFLFSLFVIYTGEFILTIHWICNKISPVKYDTLRFVVISYVAPFLLWITCIYYASKLLYKLNKVLFKKAYLFIFITLSIVVILVSAYMVVYFSSPFVNFSPIRFFCLLPLIFIIANFCFYKNNKISD